jgi:hypothetical protein
MRFVLMAAIAVVSASQGLEARPANDPAAPVRGFIDAFNKGDAATGFAMHAPGDVSITDEFAPYHWSGRGAAQAWAAGYASNAKANGISDGIVGYGRPARIERSGRTAYVLLPTTYRFKQRGRTMTEAGSITAVVVRLGGAWKMRSWTWSSPAPHRVR